MMNELKGRVALLTGASGGIGRAIAQRLAEEGVSLALLGRNTEKLNEVAALVHTEVITLPGDLLCDEYKAECVKRTVERFGRLDILVNNAGIAASGNFEDTPIEEYQRVMDTNAKAPFVLCQRALPHLIASSNGAIINIASVVAHDAYAYQAAYAASKHALIGFTKALAKEVYERGVRVHVISPGGVDTDMVRLTRPDLSGAGLISPYDIADIAIFLLKNRGNAVIDEICVHRAGKQPF